MSKEVTTTESSRLKELFTATDALCLEALPTKKGFLVKHVEYTISSERFKTKIVRRYSDFVALNEALRQRYPYRLIPRLPPAKLSAYYSGIDSNFADIRQRGLSRWLKLVCAHPSFKDDPLIENFLTHLGSDYPSQVREEFRSLPDEFITSHDSHMALEQRSVDLELKLQGGRCQIFSLESSLSLLLALVMKEMKRSLEAAADWEEFGKELANLSNERESPSLISDESSDSRGEEGYQWSDLQGTVHEFAKQCSPLTTELFGKSESIDVIVMEAMKMLQDVLLGYKDLCDRTDRFLSIDHRKSLDRVANIKKRQKLSGILLTDTKLLESIDKRIQDFEPLLSDLEVRKAFSLQCLAQEMRFAFDFTELMGHTLSVLAHIESKSHQRLSQAWQQLEIQVKDLAMN